MKISIVLGTRSALDYSILHTGQHYSYNMGEVFFEQLELPEARHNLDMGSGTHAEQTGKMLIGIEIDRY
jgi:UDP-N-acetylglucosamine 2-epimerase (non-hydrolysing)